ncbi:MAG: ABC transporter ATP-binding protein [Ruminococcaceae bacterium]|nr:ABC transporter ATP-binding protein [Oscillospiraceae bacterium]
MKQILKNAWQTDKKGLLWALFLNIAVALTGSISIVMLIPMLDLLEVSVGDNGGTLGILLQPFAGMTYLQRAIVIIVIYVVIMLLSAVLTAVSSVHQNTYLGRYHLNMRRSIYRAISKADWETLSAKTGTDLIQLITNQSMHVRTCLQQILGLITSVFSALIQLAIAVWMSPPVTLMALLVGAGFLVLFRPIQKKSKEFGKQTVQARQKLHKEINNQILGIKEIRAYGAEEHHAQLFQEISQEQYDISQRMHRMWAKPRLCYSIASALLIALAFVYSVLILDTGTAQLVVLVYIFSRLWPVFSSWQNQLQNIQSNIPAYDTIQESIQELKKRTKENAASSPKVEFTQSIAFDHVGFTYQNGNEEVLKDICFELPYGSVTALVGPSGAGKSTTADLLLGLLAPTKGNILVDGVPLTGEGLSETIGYIPQEPLILNATVRENLLRFHPQASEEEMLEALKRSLAWPFVEKLPEGLDTYLGDKGVRLSGGERQRIVLARVLMGKPKLIILDEATSALDYESESFVRETIRSLRDNTTVLIIAHRMATIRGADRAIVLLDGQIAEQGSLQELLEKEDTYLAKMVSME